MPLQYGKSLLEGVIQDMHRIYTFEDYSRLAWNTAIYPNKGTDLNYPVIKLNGEAGEVAEKYGKILRDKAGIIDLKDTEAIKRELGDVLWYINAIAVTLGLSLEDVAQENIDKLYSRKDRDMLHGEGDDR